MLSRNVCEPRSAGCGPAGEALPRALWQLARIFGASAMGGAKVQVLYAGDDDTAKQAVRDLIESAGFEAVDAGPLANARGVAPGWVPVA
jgi:hypothetical protein